MKLQHLRCAGIDVHKRRVTVCVRIVEEGVARIEIREFGTATGELLELCDWLKENRIPSLAMESTGSYWKPLYNLMEGDFQILLANAQHMKAVPGRKTDTKDAEWISELYAHGLLRASFVPNVEQRGMRELTRTRASLVGERARLANRIQKVLENANIKLASVAANVLGVSGRVMLKAIIDGEEDPRAISELARGLLRKKIPELEQAVQGRVRPHHRIVLRELLKQVESLDDSVRVLERAIEEAMTDSDRPFETGVSLLCTIPGVAEVGGRARFSPNSGRTWTSSRQSATSARGSVSLRATTKAQANGYLAGRPPETPGSSAVLFRWLTRRPKRRTPTFKQCIADWPDGLDGSARSLRSPTLCSWRCITCSRTACSTKNSAKATSTNSTLRRRLNTYSTGWPSWVSQSRFRRPRCKSFSYQRPSRN